MNHKPWVWTPAHITFDIVDEMSAGSIVTIAVTTPIGVLKVMAEAAMAGRTLILDQVHVQDGWPNAVGWINLRLIAGRVMEGLDLDGLVIKGAIRTTGANPGRRPRVIRFTRRVRALHAGWHDSADC
jgi:hypothetical protein